MLLFRSRDVPVLSEALKVTERKLDDGGGSRGGRAESIFGLLDFSIELEAPLLTKYESEP